MDLIMLLQSGQITLQQAEQIFDETIQKIHNHESPPEWWETLGMSKHEATAYAHGADLEDIVKLRFNGWPSSCSRCGQPIDYKQYGWWFVHQKDGKPRLRHIVCPTPKSASRSKGTKTKRRTRKQGGE
jgi:hypothetical protein